MTVNNYEPQLQFFAYERSRSYNRYVWRFSRTFVIHQYDQLLLLLGTGSGRVAAEGKKRRTTSTNS